MSARQVVRTTSLTTLSHLPGGFVDFINVGARRSRANPPDCHRPGHTISLSRVAHHGYSLRAAKVVWQKPCSRRSGMRSIRVRLPYMADGHARFQPNPITNS